MTHSVSPAESVLARSYSDFTPEKLREIYDRARLTAIN
jgi:hypothetical protein